MLGRHVHVVHRLGQRRLVSAPPAATVRAYRCAVIGSPVAHSLSPVLHRAAYTALGLTDWAYDVLEVASADLAGVLGRLAAPTPPGEATWRGLSVTMPHKQTVLDHLDVVDPLAVAVGAVNTVVAQRSGTDAALTAGFNTDVAGIVGAIREVRTDAGRPAPQATSPPSSSAREPPPARPWPPSPSSAPPASPWRPAATPDPAAR